MEKNYLAAHGVYEPELDKKDLAKTVAVGTGGLALLVGGLILIEMGCNKYIPQIYDCIKGFK